MGLELPITTNTTYYEMISQIESTPTLLIKEKKTSKSKTTSPLIKLSEFTSSQPPSSQKPPYAKPKSPPLP
jgi:hypothetical protein